MLIHIFLSFSAALLTAPPESPVVIWASPNLRAFHKYCDDLPVSPTAARLLMTEYIRTQGDERELEAAPFHHLNGIVGDHYVFTNGTLGANERNKRGFNLVGYHVHVSKGTVKEVTLRDLATMFEGRFSNGIVGPGVMHRYERKLDRVEE